MTRKKPTITDLRALKGTAQLTMLRVMSLDEAAAAEAAGIDIVSVPPNWSVIRATAKWRQLCFR